MKGLSIKGATTGLNFLVTIFLAHLLGASQYGIYAYSLAVISILSIFASVGLPNLVVRETARAATSRAWSLIAGLWFWASRMAVMNVAAAVAAGLVAIWIFAHSLTILQIQTFISSLALVPFLVFCSVCAAAIRGMGYAISGQLIEKLVTPSVFILLLSLAWGLRSWYSLNSATAMLLNVVSALVAFLLAVAYVGRISGPIVRHRHSPRFQAAPWRWSALSLSLIAGVQVINSNLDILILGIFAPSSDVAAYRVAAQVALLVIFGLQAANQVFSPLFAKFNETPDHTNLQDLASLSAKISFTIAIPIAIFFVLFGESILRGLFGSEFSAGYPALVILAGAQVINAAAGSVGVILNMTGFERYTVYGVVTAAAVNLLLNVLLIPPFGMTGAAIATGISITIWNTMLWFFVRAKVGVISVPFRPRRLAV